MTNTIAIVNQKGGVGKSTTAVNLGAGLARQEAKVSFLPFLMNGLYMPSSLMTAAEP